LFSLENSSGTLVASNQTATGSSATSGCASYLIDPNQYTLANSCHIEPYYFKYTHPAGYIYYAGTMNTIAIHAPSKEQLVAGDEQAHQKRLA